jgi:hypothetical protein
MTDEEFRRSPRTAQSSRGFTVRLVGRDLLEYREGDHVMTFGVEPTGPRVPEQLIFYTGRQYSVRWEPPFDGEPVSRARHEEIVQNVLRALGAMNLRAQVV